MFVSGDDASRPPSKQDVANKIRALIDGRISREEAAKWADYWASNDNVDLGPSLTEALEELSMADMGSTDRRYLFARADFEAWLKALLGKVP